MSALLAVTFLFIACKKDDAAPGSGSSGKYDKEYYGRQSFIIALNGNYIIYDSVLKVTGLIDTLAQPGPFTPILLDNNSIGWGSVNNGIITSFNPPANASFVLRSLIIPGAHSFKSLPVGSNQMFTTLAGNHLYISKYSIGSDSMVYTVNGIRITTADFPSTNGPIQVIDSIKPNLETYSSVLAYVNSTPELTFLSLALKRTGLDKLLDGSTAGSWTLLAPYDGAFKNSSDSSLNTYEGLLKADTARLARILRYHIIPERDFLFDFVYKIQNNDTLRLNTMLPQHILPFFTKGTQWWQSFGYFFMGPGNVTPGDGSSDPVPNPASLYQLGYPNYVANMVTVNGTVHEIDNVLLP